MKKVSVKYTPHAEGKTFSPAFKPGVVFETTEEDAKNLVSRDPSVYQIMKGKTNASK